MKNAFFGFLFFLSTAVFAQVGPEISNVKTPDIYAPNVGSSEIYAGVILPTGSLEFQGHSADYSGFILGVEYGYGFTEYLTGYVAQSYANYDIKTDFTGTSVTQTNKGFANTTVGVKGVIDSAPGFFYYDVNYNRALLEKDKTDTSSNESTAASARPSLNFTVGAGADVQSFGFGALLGYSLYQDGDHETDSNAGNTTTTYKAANGSQWKIYAQFEPSWKIGLSYALNTVDSYDQTKNGVTTKQDKSETKSYSVYGIVPVNAQSDVFIQVIKPEAQDTNGVDYKLYYVSAAYRTTF